MAVWSMIPKKPAPDLIRGGHRFSEKIMLALGGRGPNAADGDGGRDTRGGEDDERRGAPRRGPAARKRGRVGGLEQVVGRCGDQDGGRYRIDRDARRAALRQVEDEGI